jgi:hypothetical protein
MLVFSCTSTHTTTRHLQAQQKTFRAEPGCSKRLYHCAEKVALQHSGDTSAAKKTAALLPSEQPRQCIYLEAGPAVLADNTNRGRGNDRR